MTEPPPSPIAVPENAERRAAITRDIQAATGLDEAVLERLVRTFYATARQDDEIGHLFDGVGDWEKHIAQISAFWSSVGLLSGRYHGQPLAAHLPLGLEPRHFVRWLALFKGTLHERWPAKFGQADKWNFCLRAARMPRIRSKHDQANTTDPRREL